MWCLADVHLRSRWPTSWRYVQFSLVFGLSHLLAHSVAPPVGFFAVHPGYVQSDIDKNYDCFWRCVVCCTKCIMRSPAEGAVTQIVAATSVQLVNLISPDPFVHLARSLFHWRWLFRRINLACTWKMLDLLAVPSYPTIRNCSRTCTTGPSMCLQRKGSFLPTSSCSLRRP